MKTHKKTRMQRLAWALLAGSSALLLMAGLSLLLSHIQVLAQPVIEITAAVLDVQKEVNAAQAAPGDTLTYTVHIHNIGDEGVTAWLTDVVPSELVYVPGSLDANYGTPALAGGVITWSGSVGVDQTARIWFSAQLPLDTAAAEIENTAQVTGTGELILSSVQTVVQSPLDNDDTCKTVNREQAGPGDVLTYTIVLSNSSGFNDVTALVTDPLHPLLDYVSGSANTTPGGSGTLSCTAGISWTVIVSKSTSVILTFQAQVSDSASGGTLINNTTTISDGTSLVERSTMVMVDLPPTSQTRSPENGAVITQKGILAVEGVAWDPSLPPFFPSDPVLQPIENHGGGGDYYVRWAEAISATTYVLEEADNPEFNNAVSFGTSDTEYFITGQGVGTYYYRVKAYNAEGRPSRWSNVESVVVGTAQAFGLSSIPAASVQVAASDPVTVWVRIDSGDWQTTTVEENVGGWWDWTYEWTLPEEDDVQHAIHTQAQDATGNFSVIDTITITLRNKNYIRYFPIIFHRWPPIPHAPTLNDIDNAGEDGDYTVSWSYDYASPPVVTYTLQEATDADFTNPTEYYPGSSESYAFSNKDDGTYYYRVQGNNEYGPGEWSNVKSATVATRYFDDFSDIGSGWPSLVGKTRWAFYEVDPNPPNPGDGSPRPTTGSGYFIARRSGSAPFARFGPGVTVPSANYEIEVDTRWWDAAYFATYQILFGANSSFSEYYAVQVRINDVGGDCRCDFSVAKRDDGETTYLQDWSPVSGIHCEKRRFSSASWNHWKIRRENNKIIVDVNGSRIGTWSDSTFGANRYFGVGCTLYEGFTPSKPEYDNYSVVQLP